MVSLYTHAVHVYIYIYIYIIIIFFFLNGTILHTHTHTHTKAAASQRRPLYEIDTRAVRVTFDFRLPSFKFWFPGFYPTTTMRISFFLIVIISCIFISFVSSSRTISSFIKAKEALRERDFVKTLAYLTEGASTQDYFKQSLSLRSSVHVVLGNFDSAILDSHRCGNVDSISLIEAKKRSYESADVAFHLQDFGKAYTISSALLKESPESLRLLLLRARAGIQLGFYNSARSDSMNALRISRFEPEAILILSRSIYSDLGNVTLAHINTQFCRMVAPDYK